MKLPRLYARVRADLSKLVTIDEVKDVLNKSIAAQVYAQQANDGQLAAHATEVRKRATHRLGEVMAELREAGLLATGREGKRKALGVLETPRDRATLEYLGVDKNLAKAARSLAAMSEEEFEASIAKAIRYAVASAEGASAVISIARTEQYEKKLKIRQAREKRLALEMPAGKFGVILADPEWNYEFWSDRAMTHSAPQLHYDTTPLDLIKARDVPSISADDCALFLWATVPMLPQCLEVMAAWGFSYKSNFVWVKDKIGTGYWNRNQHELLLVGTRGAIPCPSEDLRRPSIIHAPVGKHSEKPDAAYELIELYFPNLPKIELNARKRRAGWEAWGFEAPEAAA
jgi:N6-adenosine-specific RNA methylase IME4